MLLLCAARLAGEPLKRLRFALGAVLGGGYAVAIFLPGLGFLERPACRLAAAVLMVLAAFWGSRRLGRQVLGVTLSDDDAAARETITRFGKLWQSWGLPTSLGQCVGVQDDATLRRMAHLCSYEGTRTVGTFRPLTETDLLAIYRLANV